MSEFEIHSPALLRLYEEWHYRLCGRDMPARSDFDVLDLTYVLGDLNLFGVEHVLFLEAGDDRRAWSTGIIGDRDFAPYTVRTARGTSRQLFLITN